MEVIKKSSPLRTSRDRWSQKALGVKMPNAPKSALLGSYTFADDFSPQRLKDIKSEAGRGPFSARLGSFKTVVEKAERTNELFAAYRDDKKVKKGGIFSKKSVVTPAEMTLQFEELIVEAQKWLGAFDEEGQREKTGVVSDKSVKPDKHRLSKMRACEDMIVGARIAIAQLKLLDLENNDEDVERLSGRLKDLQNRIETSHASEKDIEMCRVLDATLLTKVCEVKIPESGTSIVALIKAPDGSLAYAYKSIQGESDQTGMPKGAGAVREVLMSRLCDRVKEENGIDFKWPKSTMVQMEIEPGKKTEGVLIDGIKGKEAYDPSAKSSIKLSVEEGKQKFKESREMLQKLPPAEIQKLALCNLAFGQYDMKWDNCFIQEDEDGGASAVPFDGGAAFPDLNLFMDTMNRGGVPGTTLVSYANEPLMCEVDGKQKEMGEAPMSPELVKMFMGLDEDALFESAKSDLKELSTYGLDAEELGMDCGTYIMAMSIKGMKKLLKEFPGISLSEFLDKYRSDVMGPLAEEMRPAWELKVTKEYGELLKLHADLLPPADAQNAQNMRNRYLLPEQRKFLAHIVELGGVDFLERDDIRVKCPLATHMSPKGVIVDVVRKRTPEDEQLRYPHIFPK